MAIKDRSGAADNIGAESRIAVTRIIAAIARGRAYELAAFAEGALEPESPLPMQELYLEQAIRAAPHSATARSAFTQIERLLAQRFKVNPPAYVTPHLERLRSLAY
jgi:hypothetical protein